MVLMSAITWSSFFSRHHWLSVAFWLIFGTNTVCTSVSAWLRFGMLAYTTVCAGTSVSSLLEKRSAGK